MISDKYILLYDGQCVLCNRWVTWLIKRDKKDLFRFAAQQSSVGHHLSRAFGVPQDLSTVALITPSAEVYYYSDVPVKVLDVLGGLYAVGGLSIWIPKLLRDNLYKLVAKYRYKWFGKKSSTCPVVPLKWKHKFFLE
jgi:predicted DCC family thiol-disulfide oxidoreductase YuxK